MLLCSITTMIKVHTTLLKNLKSIRRFGILASYSRQKRRATWFHNVSEKSWGENHVRLNHDAQALEIVHIYVDVPKSRLKQHGKGLFYVMGDVPASAIRRVTLVTRVEQELPV